MEGPLRRAATCHGHRRGPPCHQVLSSSNRFSLGVQPVNGEELMSKQIFH